MKSKIHLHSLLFTLYSLLFFITPLLVTPFTDELFEFPKMIFVYLVTSFVLFLFTLKMILGKKITIKKNPFIIPLVLVLIISTISTIFSKHPPTSFFGYYTRFNGGLLSIFCYAILTFICMQEFKSEEIKKILSTLLGSATIVATYGILQRFGIDRNYWVEHSWKRVFSTLGQPNWLASFLILTIPYTFIETITNILLFLKRKTPKELILSILFTFSTIVQILALIFTKSASGYLAFFIIMIVSLVYIFIFFKPKRYKKIITITSFVTIISSFFIILSFYPSIPKNLLDLFWYKETNQIRLIVWKGTAKLISSKPILGYGLETFPYTFLSFRPTEFNRTSEWNFLMNKPHNEYLEILSETGIVGLIIYAIWTLGIFSWVYKNRNKIKNKKIIFALLSGYLGLLASLFFGFHVVLTNLLFFLVPIFIVHLSEIKYSTHVFSFKLSLKKQSITIALLTTCYLLLATGVVKMFVANVFYTHGTLSSVDQAVTLVPYENTYRRNLAYNYAISATKNNNYEKVAVHHINEALLKNPYDFLTLETLTKTYLELTSRDMKYLDDAASLSYRQTTLSPTDPEVFYTYGLLLMTKGNNEEAQKSFQKALELKPDYEKAREMLSSF